MRPIHLIRHRGYRPQGPIAFSQRRQAERYIESIVKKAWKEATDLDAIGARHVERIREHTEVYGADHPYVREFRQNMARDMEVARQTIDRGYRDFRDNYEYRVGDLPVIEEVRMFRTVAEYLGT